MTAGYAVQSISMLAENGGLILLQTVKLDIAFFMVDMYK